MLSDSCHSGSMAKDAVLKYMMTLLSTQRELLDSPGDVSHIHKLRQLDAQGANLIQAAGIDEQSKVRVVPIDVELGTYVANQTMYDQITRDNPPSLKAAVRASVLLISGCQDDQTSADGTRNGLFTAALLAVWKNGQFNGNYPNFYDAIRKIMPTRQRPNYFPVGATSPSWDSDKPFVA